MLFMKETKTMTTIYDTELFHELRANPEWETLWTTDASGHYPVPKCGWLPRFAAVSTTFPLLISMCHSTISA